MTWAGQSVFALPCGDNSAGGATSWGVKLAGESTATSSLLTLGDLSFGFQTLEAGALTVTLTGSVRIDSTATDLEFFLYLNGAAMEDVGALQADAGVVAVALTSHDDLAAGEHTLEVRWRASNGGATAFTGQLHLEAISAKAGEIL